MPADCPALREVRSVGTPDDAIRRLYSPRLSDLLCGPQFRNHIHLCPKKGEQVTAPAEEELFGASRDIPRSIPSLLRNWGMSRLSPNFLAPVLLLQRLVGPCRGSGSLIIIVECLILLLEMSVDCSLQGHLVKLVG